MWELEAHSKSLQLTTIHTGHEIKMLMLLNRPQIILFKLQCIMIRIRLHASFAARSVGSQTHLSASWYCTPIGTSQKPMSTNFSDWPWVKLSWPVLNYIHPYKSLGEQCRFSVECIIKLKYLFAWNFFFPCVDSWLSKMVWICDGQIDPASISLSSQGSKHAKLLVTIFNRIVHRSDCGDRSRTFAFEALVVGPANQDICSHPIPNRSQFITF
jgi:hypothetical protein